MKKRYEYVIIAGCGRLGASLASMLSEHHVNVVIIDRDSNSFRKLSKNFSGFTIEADVTESDTLVSAKVDKADIVVATTDDDNVNILVSQISSGIYHVPRVIARLHDPARRGAYEGLHIQTICPATLSVEAFKRILLNEGDM